MRFDCGCPERALAQAQEEITRLKADILMHVHSFEWSSGTTFTEPPAYCRCVCGISYADSQQAREQAG